MNDSIDSLIYLSLEIEGLLTLIERREDNTPKVVLAMLRDKAAQLKAGIDRLDPDFKAEPSLPSEPAQEMAASVEFEVRNDAVSVSDMVSAPTPIPVAAPEPVVECKAQVPVESPKAVETELTVVKPKKETPAEVHVPDPIPVVEEKQISDAPASRTLGDMHKAFTLNDKFRFRRELFHNSEEEFSDALSVISNMSDADEVADYLYNDLCLDPSNDDVKEFLGVITAFISH